MMQHMTEKQQNVNVNQVTPHLVNINFTNMLDEIQYNSRICYVQHLTYTNMFHIFIAGYQTAKSHLDGSDKRQKLTSSGKL